MRGSTAAANDCVPSKSIGGRGRVGISLPEVLKEANLMEK